MQIVRVMATFVVALGAATAALAQKAGVAGFEYTFWNGLWAPAGTPVEVVEKISKNVARVLAMEDVRERFAKLGAEAIGMTPVEFARFVRSEIEDSARIAKAAGIKPQ